MSHDHINPLQWHQAVGLARQSCARIFRDGGTPADALRAFGIVKTSGGRSADWSKVVELIAESLCAQQPVSRAA